MQAERAPFVGIVLALLVVAVETLGLFAYASPEPASAAHVGKVQTSQSPTYKPIRCRR